MCMSVRACTLTTQFASLLFSNMISRFLFVAKKLIATENWSNQNTHTKWDRYLHLLHGSNRLIILVCLWVIFICTLLQTSGRKARAGGAVAAPHHVVSCNQYDGHQYKHIEPCIPVWTGASPNDRACIRWKHRMWSTYRGHGLTLWFWIDC
jgi:hypothetical protein